jgi:hypothetical protein
MTKAFRGELVPTEAELARREHRPYEPASALLARIRASRASTESNGAPRRRRAARQEASGQPRRRGQRLKAATRPSAGKPMKRSR